MVTRRDFFRLAGVSAAAFAAGEAQASDEGHSPLPGSMGMLTDATLCVGCRSCEAACKAVNDLPEPERPFTDTSVLDEKRRMDGHRYTVVNRYPSTKRRDTFVNVKIQCNHCVDPACVSACLVGTLTKTKEGPVTWEAWKCMGCRYCMVACPFGVPTYEYHKGIGPRVMKCTMCHPRIIEGLTPGCAEACPMQAITFGPREELIKIAKERIRRNPGQYVDHIYGEHEVGGTAWLYLAPQSFESLEFLTLPEDAPPRLTESIQHGVFKYFIPPVLLFSGLATLMAITKPKGGHGHGAAPAEGAAEDAETAEGEEGDETPEGETPEKKA